MKQSSMTAEGVYFGGKIVYRSVTMKTSLCFVLAALISCGQAVPLQQNFDLNGMDWSSVLAIEERDKRSPEEIAPELALPFGQSRSVEPTAQQLPDFASALYDIIRPRRQAKNIYNTANTYNPNSKGNVDVASMGTAFNTDLNGNVDNIKTGGINGPVTASVAGPHFGVDVNVQSPLIGNNMAFTNHGNTFRPVTGAIVDSLHSIIQALTRTKQNILESERAAKEAIRRAHIGLRVFIEETSAAIKDSLNSIFKTHPNHDNINNNVQDNNFNDNNNLPNNNNYNNNNYHTTTIY